MSAPMPSDAPTPPVDDRAAHAHAPARARWLLVALVLLAITLALAVAPTRDPDLPWHLRTGALAWEQRSTLPVDPFSSLFAGAPWRYKDLVGDVALHLAVAALGLVGLVVLDVLAAGVAVVGLAAALERAHRKPVAVLVGASLALAATWFPQRPSLFSWAAFPALVGALAYARRRLVADVGARAMARALAPAIGVQWAWVQLHRAAPVGFALFALLAAQLLAARLGGDRPLARALLGPAPRRRLAVAMVVAALATALLLALVNPSGARFFTTSADVAQSDMLRRYIVEHQPLPLAQLARFHPFAAALTALALAACLGRLAHGLWRRGPTPPPIDLFDVALLVALLALTTTRARWLPFLLFAAAIPLARVIGELAARASRRGALPAAVVLAGVIAVLARRERGAFTVQMDPDRYPIGAMDFAHERGLRGPVANALSLGGYALWKGWPDVRVLVDGRNDQVYPPDFVLKTILAHKRPELFAEMRRQDGATWVLASNVPHEVTHKFLARDPRWALVYWSESATVYVERAAHPELAAWAFRFVDDPDGLDVGVRRGVLEARGDATAARAVVAELGRMVVASPNSLRAQGALCFALQLLGPAWRSERDAAFARLRALAPDSEVLGQLEAMRAAAP
jgi:hypothetical protein